MRNGLQANIVKLDYAVTPWTWYATTIAYDGVAHNGCLLIWDEKRCEQEEYRPCEIGTAAECVEIAARWNDLVA